MVALAASAPPHCCCHLGNCVVNQSYCFDSPSVLSPLCPGHTEGLSELLTTSVIEHVMIPLKNNKTKPQTTKPQSTTSESILRGFNGLLFLVLLCDMSWGFESFPIARSAPVSSHVAMRTEGLAFLPGTSRPQHILFWGSAALQNDSLRREIPTGLILNLLLEGSESNALGVQHSEGYFF